jgi:hypothetical protein
LLIIIPHSKSQLSFSSSSSGDTLFKGDPGARRWKADMIARLKERKANPDSVLDLDRCAQRCVDLASGRYDELSGTYSELQDSLDEMLRKVRAAGC